ncbi:MAG: sodium:calcium antiporter [Syntrophomonadaceae bacterium]|nr:sodium:calcium antiporter [Syntrophomonadaceae bacterium]
MGSVVLLVISLAIILLGAEVFTNGVEWLGKELNLSEGAVGSILAAVGTALPETLIPVIAILFGGAAEGREIGIGAILGAPLMLSTLAMFVTGSAVVGFSRRRLHGTKVKVDTGVITRDLGFFLIVFTAAVLVGIVPWRRWQLFVAGLLVLSYLWYVYVTLNGETGMDNDVEGMRRCYFAFWKDNPSRNVIVFQVLAAIMLIIMGADTFVASVKDIARAYHVPAFILALIISPVATELPEKFNSLIWVSRGKDTLALGNITGAMVFQSSLIPALGIIMTDWRLGTGALISAVCALLAAGLLYFQTVREGHISASTLLLCGVFYGVFVLGVVEGVIR